MLIIIGGAAVGVGGCGAASAAFTAPVGLLYVTKALYVYDKFHWLHLSSQWLVANLSFLNLILH